MDQSKKYCRTPFVQVRMARQDLQDHETTCWAFQRKPNIAFLGDFFGFLYYYFLDFTKTLGELFRKNLTLPSSVIFWISLLLFFGFYENACWAFQKNSTLPSSVIFWISLLLFFGFYENTCWAFQKNSTLPSSESCQDKNRLPSWAVVCRIVSSTRHNYFATRLATMLAHIIIE